MNQSAWLLAATAAALVAACSPGPKSGWGFRLPDGDPQAGRQAFLDLRCNACHRIASGDIPYAGTGQAVALGGEVSRVDSYGTLVTSIINPSHKIAPNYPSDVVMEGGESRMVAAGLNDAMTVQQLVDLVVFLQSQYKVKPPPYDPYRHIYP